jgi:predicted O-methyltransferase YrrM
MARLDITVPDDIPTAVTREEAAKLATLATGGDVLELGAWHGFSTVILAQAARRVVSVDWHQGDESISAMHGGEGDTWDTYRANLARYGVTANVDARRGRFEDVLPELARQGVLFDGCFIDAQHDTASVEADLALALPLVRPGGFIAFHDYGRGEQTGHPGFGVTEAADKFGVAGRVGYLAWGFVPGAPSGQRPGRTLTVIGLPYQADGSGYHRFYLPFQHLRANSRHIYGLPAPGTKVPTPTAADMEDIDVLVMQRPAFQHGSRMLDRLTGHVALVLETDDDMLTVESSNLGHFAADPRARDSVEYCLRRADMVTVSTPYLAELYAPFSSNIRVLPNYVKASLLDMPRKRRERVTVGWQGGTSHLIDLCAVQDPLRQVLDAHPDVDMHWIGWDMSPLVRRPCRFTPWFDDVGDYYKAVDFDIAIAPLADVPFNRAKSHLKALDAAARGIPIVATDMEPYRDFVIDGVTGYLVRTEDEWVARLTELIHDGAAREELGAKAYEQAKAYTMQGNWQKWEAAYQEAAR